MNEVYGAENFIAQLVWLNQEGGGGSDSELFRIKHEYILVYSKNIDDIAINGVDITNIERYTSKDEHFDYRGPYYLQKLNQASIQYSVSLDYEIIAPDGERLLPKQDNKRACWRWSKSKVQWGIENDFLVFKKDKDGKWQVYTKQYLKVDNNNNLIERKNRPMGVISNYSTTQASKTLYSLFGDNVFDYSKPFELIKYLLDLMLDPDGIILDFFAGSCTTAHAVLADNYEEAKSFKFICIQLPEYSDITHFDTISNIGKIRIKKVIEQIETKRNQETSKTPLLPNELSNNDFGFKVLKYTRSNFKKWNSWEEENIESIIPLFDNLKDPLISNWKMQDLFNEILLLEGFPLTSKISYLEEISQNKIYKTFAPYFCDHNLFICLEETIQKTTIDNLTMEKEDIFICLDSALSDELKAHVQNKFNVHVI